MEKQTPEFTRRQLVALVLLVEGGMGGLAVVLGPLLGLPAGDWIRIEWLEVGLGLGGAAGLVGFLLFLWHFPVGPWGRLRRYAQNTLRPMFQSCRARDLLVVAILAGVGEELFFRGLVQGALARWWGDGAGLCVASILFGLAHCLTREYAILATLMGLLLGWLVLVTGNLAAAIIVHAVYDYAALLLLVRGGRR